MQPGGEGRRGPIPVPLALRAALGIEPTPHLSLELLKSFRGRQFVVQPSEKAGLRHAARHTDSVVAGRRAPVCAYGAGISRVG